MPEILASLHSPIWWFSNVVIALLVSIAANFLFRYFVDEASRPNVHHLLISASTFHAVLSVVVLVVLLLHDVQVSASDKVSPVMASIVLALIFCFGIVGLAKTNDSTAAAQLLTFVVSFILLLYVKDERYEMPYRLFQNYAGATMASLFLTFAFSSLYRFLRDLIQHS